MKQLTSKICQWQEEGNELITGGDWNTNMALAQWLSQWASLGLYEPIKKGNSNREASYNQGGCNQIDAIYVSPLLKEFEYELKEIDEGICGADHS